MPDNQASIMIKFLGVPITKAIARLVEAARASGGTAEATFNGIPLVATPETSPDDLRQRYDDECKRRSEAWRASPKGKAAARKAASHVAALSAKRDALLARLDALDFGDLRAIIGWLSDLQPVCGHVDVRMPHERILEAFVRHGFLPNENMGDAFDGEDRENVARYLIGQALEGLQDHVHEIHPKFIQFADDWRRKFKRKATTTGIGG